MVSLPVVNKLESRVTCKYRVLFPENENWRISQKVNCQTFNCVYIIECQKQNCHKRYIGQTKRKLKNRIADHRGYISNQVLSTPTREHFNLPGHFLADMKVSVIEQVRQNDE